MARFFVFLSTCIVSLITIVSISSAQAPTTTPLTEEHIIARAIEGQDRIFARDYPAAEKIFATLTQDAPTSPAGPFGTMAMLELRMLEREDFHLEKAFLEAAREGRQRAEAIQLQQNPSPWELFLAGSVLGLDGFFKARKDQWWDAYVEGGKSRQIFRHVKTLDPNFIDADFGLGMYIFWRSVFTRDLWFLRMFPDKRNEGIAIVERVAREGKLVKDMARVNLVIMYFEQKRFQDACKILDEYLARYPRNVILKRLMGKSLLALGRFDEAVQQFKGIIAIDPEITQPHYFIGAALVLKGNPAGYAEAERELNQFLKMQGGRYWPAHAHYWLGRIAEAKGDKVKATEEYNAAMAFDPKIRDAVARVRGLGGGVSSTPGQPQ